MHSTSANNLQSIDIRFHQLRLGDFATEIEENDLTINPDLNSVAEGDGEGKLSQDCCQPHLFGRQWRTLRNWKNLENISYRETSII